MQEGGWGKESDLFGTALQEIDTWSNWKIKEYHEKNPTTFGQVTNFQCSDNPPAFLFVKHSISEFSFRYM